MLRPQIPPTHLFLRHVRVYARKTRWHKSCIVRGCIPIAHNSLHTPRFPKLTRSQRACIAAYKMPVHEHTSCTSITKSRREQRGTMYDYRTSRHRDSNHTSYGKRCEANLSVSAIPCVLHCPDSDPSRRCRTNLATHARAYAA